MLLLCMIVVPAGAEGLAGTLLRVNVIWSVAVSCLHLATQRKVCIIVVPAEATGLAAALLGLIWSGAWSAAVAGVHAAVTDV